MRSLRFGLVLGRFNLVVAGALLVRAPSVRADSLLPLPSVVFAAPGDPSGASPAVDSRTGLSLADVLTNTLKASPALAGFRIDEAIALATLAEFEGVFDWQLDADLSVTRRPLSEPLRGDASVTISKLLPFGTRVSVGGAVGVGRATGGGTRVTTWDDSLTATITAPLLRGAGSRVVGLPRRSARIAAQVALTGAELAARNQVATVATAYWDLALAHEQVKISQSALDLANERKRNTAASVAAKNGAAVELLAAEQIVATREEEVAGAQLAVVDRSINLRSLAYLPISSKDFVVDTSVDVSLPGRRYDLDESIAAALAASPSLAQLRLNVESASVAVELAEDGLLPELTGILSIGPLGAGATFGDAVSELGKADNLAIIGTLSLSHSIGNNAAQAALSASKLRREKVNLSATDITSQLSAGVAAALSAMQLAETRTALATRVIDLATKNVEAEKARFSLGDSTNFDVLARLDELRQAELRRVRAIADWHRAEIQLLSLTGQLLPALGVTR